MFSFKSYFVFLGRNKAYTAINLVGFAVALMFVVLLGLYVAGENRADKFHAKKDRIFRLLDGSRESQWPVPIAADIAGRYPEVEATVRAWVYTVSVEPSPEAGNSNWESFRTEAIAADPTFFPVFDYPVVAGDRGRLLNGAHDAVISEKLALSLFGSPEEAVGQPIMIDRTPHIVTGVVGDFGKSHLETPGVILNFDGQTESYAEYGYSAANFKLYLLTREGADLHPKLAEMAEWLKGFFWVYKNGLETEVLLEPITESYFNSTTNDGASGDRQLIWVLGVATMVILLFALINYINLSVALSGFRAREAATRRLLGGTRAQLMGSYVAESVLFCVAAFVAAVALAAAVQPLFNRVMESDISVAGALRMPVYIAAMVGLAVVLGVVSGIFPAVVVSRYKPIEVVRGEMARKTRTVYSRLFIGLQFCLTIILIACAITIQRQTTYMRTADLGFDKEQLIHMGNTVGAERIAGLRDRLMSVPGVEMVSFSLGNPATGNGNNITMTREEEEKSYSYREFAGDRNFIEIFGFEAASRTGNDVDSAVWINQAAERLFELTPEDPALPIAVNGMEAVKGTLKNFHMNDLSVEIKPMIIGALQDGTGEYTDDPWDIFVKIDTADPARAFDEVVRAHKEYNGGFPFESEFVDVMIDEWYDGHRRTSTMVGWFSVLAIVLSAMGLVAMSTYFMRQRAREIAVRKVFGSTSRQVLERLVRSFLSIVAVAFVVAVPVAVWLMARWLSSFAFRIPLGWSIFALSGVAALVIAVGAVMWQSLSAANANPVETLKK